MARGSSVSVMGLAAGLALLAGLACQPAAAPAPAGTSAATAAAGATSPAAKATSAPTSSLRAQTPADTLVIGLINAPETIDSGVASSDLLPEPIYHRLLTSREDKYVPQLASWTIVDVQTARFVIKDGAKFADGSPVLASDVKFNFDRVMNPANSQLSQVRQVLGGLREARVISPTTLEIVAAAPDPLLIGKSWRIPVAPQAWIESRTPDQLAQTANGAGPYIVKEFVPKSKLVLEANPMSLTKGVMPKVTMNFLPEAASRTAALRSGQIDIAEQVLSDDAASLKAEGYQVFSAARAAGIALAMVPGPESPFNDVRVRQAVELAIDRQSLVNNLYAGNAKPLESQPAQPGMLGYDASVKAQFNLERSRQLLTEAGVGQGFQSPLRYTPAVPGWAPAAEAVSGMVQRVGIRTNLEQIELSLWFARGAANPNGNGPFHMAQSAFIVPDVSYHLGFWRTPNNRGFSNPAYDQLFLQSQSELDPARRERLLIEAQKQIIDAKYYLYLLAPTVNIAAYPNVKGLNLGLVSTTSVELIGK